MLFCFFFPPNSCSGLRQESAVWLKVCPHYRPLILLEIHSIAASNGIYFSFSNSTNNRFCGVAVVVIVVVSSTLMQHVNQSHSFAGKERGTWRSNGGLRICPSLG